MWVNVMVESLEPKKAGVEEDGADESLLGEQTEEE